MNSSAFSFLCHFCVHKFEAMDSYFFNVIAIIVVIAVITGFLWWKFQKEIQFTYKKQKAEGIIVNWMGATQEGKRVFYPMIEFEVPGRGSITFRAEEMCTGEPLYERGTRVEVFYLPSDPEIRKVIYPS